MGPCSPLSPLRPQMPLRFSHINLSRFKSRKDFKRAHEWKNDFDMNCKFWKLFMFVNRWVCWRVCENFISQLNEIRDVKGFTIIHLNSVNTLWFERLVVMAGWYSYFIQSEKRFWTHNQNPNPMILREKRIHCKNQQYRYMRGLSAYRRFFSHCVNTDTLLSQPQGKQRSAIANSRERKAGL
jgi:hypothetical protein